MNYRFVNYFYPKELNPGPTDYKLDRNLIKMEKFAANP